jgi:hypothetical protein
MKVGDIKGFLERVISSDRRDNLNPRDFNINDKALLSVVSAYKKGEPAEYIEKLVAGFIQTEKLSVEKRCATLYMVRDVLISLSKSSVSQEDRDRLRALLTAYFI